MKTNSWLALSLAFYVAGSASGFAAQPASSAQHKKTKPKDMAAKPLSSPKVAAPPLEAGPAEATPEHLNVRAQADVDSEVVARLSRGDVVKVVEEVVTKKAGPGEPVRWAKIVWPANVPVWVFADFVDKDSLQVKVPKLNLRSGPGENYTVVGHLEKGEKLKKLDAKGDWWKVEAPEGCHAFVAANLLHSKPARPEAGMLTAPSARPGTGTAPNRSLAGLRPGPPPLPGGTAVPPTTTTDVPRDTVVTHPRTAPVPTFALPPPQPPRPAPTLAPPSVPPQTPAHTASTTPPRATPTLTREPGQIDFRPQREEPYVKRIVTREGLVRRSLNIQAPTPLILENVHNGRVMNYLYSTSTNLNLTAFRGRVVTVTGEEALDERWPNVPVIRVDTLQTDP